VEGPHLQGEEEVHGKGEKRRKNLKGGTMGKHPGFHFRKKRKQTDWRKHNTHLFISPFQGLGQKKAARRKKMGGGGSRVYPPACKAAEKLPPGEICGAGGIRNDQRKEKADHYSIIASQDKNSEASQGARN